jgi:hypothetical protein
MAGCSVDRDGIALWGAGQFTGAPDLHRLVSDRRCVGYLQLFLTFLTGALAIRNAFLLSIAGSNP